MIRQTDGMEDDQPQAKIMDYDRILQSIGEFGFYQKRTCVLLAIIAIPYGIQTTSGVFQTFKLPFRCAVPGLPNDTYKIQDESHERLVRAHIPIDSDTGQFVQCERYSQSTHLEKVHYTTTSMPNQNKTSTCDRWVYNVDEFGNSMAVEMNLVCEREIYKTHINMVMMLGLLVGSLVGGSLPDFFGRKKVLVFSVMLQCIPGIALAFAWSVPVVMALRFILSVAGVSAFLALYVLLAEVVGVSRRAIATMWPMIGWAIGMVVLLVIQYFIRDWRTAQIVQTAPFCILIIYWWIVQESPRWLLTGGKLQEAEDIIRYMAKVNKVNLSQETEPVTSMCVITDESDQSNKQSSNANFLQICYKPILVVRISILAVCWITINIVYFGLVLGVGDVIEGDLFVNFAVQVIMELISDVVLMYIFEKVGRKKLFCSSIITAGVSCISISIIMITETKIRWLSVVIFSLGKFSITFAYSLTFIITAELLPTTVRNSGMGFCSFAGRIGGVSSPYIASVGLLMSGPIGKAFPVLLFGAVSLISGLLSLWLPETLGKKLPETIDDANNFNRKLEPRKKNTDQTLVL